MNKTLDDLVELVRNHRMTKEERRAQKISLIMGLRSSKSTLTYTKCKELLNY